MPEDYACRCAELNQPAMALLDFDGVYGAPRFHLAMERKRISRLIWARRLRAPMGLAIRF